MNNPLAAMFHRSALALVLVHLLIGSVNAQQKIEFSRDVLPILSDRCFACHGPDAKARKADLRLDIKAEAFASGTIEPGKSEKSELIRRVMSTDSAEQMPPPKFNKKLTPKQIATLKAWVDQGAVWSQHWAFVPVSRPAVPRLGQSNPIDNFILAKLKSEHWAFSPAATKEQLIRRVTLDLTGLPPTIEEVEAFIHDQSIAAYEKVVDRLLASPHYGERMAWDWLDAARYADSNGYQGDNDRTMWPWRDWVIKSFNENLPYDRFTIWQLAGDLLPNATQEQILATGFNRNHMINGEGGRIAEENRVEYVFDQTETVGTVWLGLTLTCSRCHDHKFDPLTRKDYYQLFAFFNQSPVNGGGGNGQTPPVIDFATPEQREQIDLARKHYDALVKQIAPIEKRLRDAGAGMKDGMYETKLPTAIESGLRKGPNGRVDANTDEIIAYYKSKEPKYIALLTKLKKAKRQRDSISIPRVMVMADLPKPRNTFMLNRGAYDKHEDQVSAKIPAMFQSTHTAPVSPNHRSNRLDLARWIVSPQNPLMARVTVNRFWQTFFGTGLVKTSDDFGVQGEYPSHPELLDWLAADFVQSGWDVKRFVKLIVTSATYRQSARITPALLERDPDNRLLARGPRHRLPAWMIRDQALASSGLLTPTIGGPSVKTYQPSGVWEEATFGKKKYQQDHGKALYRRSLYIFWRRIVGPTLFFDAANRQTCSVKTTITNTPLHALTTLNDITFVEAARALAQLSIEKGGKSNADWLAFAFRRITARTPSNAERDLLSHAFEKRRRIYAHDQAAAQQLLAVGESLRNPKLNTTDHAALTAVCLLMLNLDEALTN